MANKSPTKGLSMGKNISNGRQIRFTIHWEKSLTCPTEPPPMKKVILKSKTPTGFAKKMDAMNAQMA